MFREKSVFVKGDDGCCENKWFCDREMVSVRRNGFVR